MNYREIIKIGFAYTGVVVGAGFSTGQEILQFYTNNGLYSILAIIVSAVIILFAGKWTAEVGYNIKADSHVDTIKHTFGRTLGTIVDIVLTFFLFGVAIIMFAGAGSTFYESFGVEPWIGSLILVIGVYITLNLNFDRIVFVLGAVTPYLLALVIIIAVISFLNPSIPFGEINNYMQPEDTPAGPSWWDGMLYSGFTIAVAFSFLTMMGSGSNNLRSAGWGGYAGGIIIVLLIILINFGMLARMDMVNEWELPTLLMAVEIHPWVGTLLSVAMLLVIYNTAVGMMYPFLARFTLPGTRPYQIFLIASMVIGYILSFVGFADLVGAVYPMMGYVGLILSIGLFVKWLMLKRGKAKKL